MKKVMGSGLVFILIGALILCFVGFRFIKARPSNSPEEVTFEVAQGKGFKQIARELADRQLIKNVTFFTLYARFRGDATKLKVGEYALRRNMTPGEVLSVITSGKSIGRAFTIVEGLNMYEIADAYQAQGFGRQEDFLNLCMNKDFVKLLLGEERESLEGYLFPETYQLTKFTTTKELLQAMVNNFHQNYRQVEPQAEVKGLTRHQIVTLASIIEKETGAPHERPRISSIFHNRLQKGMLLQTDPTIIYGLADIAKKTVYKISKADILRPTKYNTYVIKGLPPGPIANPGKQALLASVKPEKTNYLYFVSQNDGTHIFSEDYQGHLAAVKKFQLDPKARQGKSWRDLQKNKSTTGKTRAQGG